MARQGRLRCLMTALWAVTGVAAQAQLFADASNRKLPNMPAYEYDKIHFGFIIGFNFQDYHIYNSGKLTAENGYSAKYADVQDLAGGLTLGIVTDLRICNHVNLRALPGISFGEKNLTFVDAFGNVEKEKERIKSTYIDFPVCFKISSYRLHNIALFVTTGNTLRYDLARDKQSHYEMRSLDAYYDIGGGVDFYLPYFRFSVELKGSFGLTNILKKRIGPDDEDIPYQQAIDAIKSRIFGITMYFE